MNKTKVVVFTQKGKWNNIDDEILNRVKVADWDEKYPNANNPIVKCGFSGVAFLIPVALDKLSDEEGVFLVYDSIAGNSFQTLEQQCRGDKVYVLTHGTGNCQQSAFINWQPKPFVLSGKHTNSDKDYYYPLFDILTDDKDDKMNRIINTIFKYQKLKNTVFQFLQGCVVPKNQDPKLQQAYLSLLENNELRDEVELFYNDYTSCDRYEDYRERLEKMQSFLEKYIRNTR